MEYFCRAYDEIGLSVLHVVLVQSNAVSWSIMFYKTVITTEKISMRCKDYESLLFASVVIVVVPAAIVQAHIDERSN